MEGWVDLGYPAMHRPGTELAISRSPVRRPTTTVTEQPVVIVLSCYFPYLHESNKIFFTIIAYYTYIYIALNVIKVKTMVVQLH